MFELLLNLFRGKKSKLSTTPPDMKYLITGLGNIGSEYANTRHNIGFDILDHLAQQENLKFEASRYGSVAYYKHKGRTFVLLKPSTYVNLSGKAVNYWLKKEKVPIKNLLVVVDDLAIPFGQLRVKSKGGDAGHNGLKSIQEALGHTQYARLRFGLGNNFRRGQQVDFVLSSWDDDELEVMNERLDAACEIIQSFGVLGVDRTMNFYNKK